ncbi:hypothetical protein KUTeg_018165 [Tegillarca granosa]|uniref:C-type lectin domain-containing protein n=1 Tax=Tegillarca granosa TaxID=220873 RepID=A0ABQ9EH19_TEGGR|nr:hypothetical protein KUTeg_018165 [Tegillarca granosa]
MPFRIDEIHCDRDYTILIRSSQAQAICMTMNAHLLEIETEEENNFIKGRHKNAHNYWTGGNDIEVESVWRWITSKNPITFFDWSVGQPSNLRHRQDCLIIHHSNHQWHDFDCRAENFFICEKE